MRVGSLFAGIGGFDLAAERVGMTVAWQSEVDKYASKVLAHHWPHVKNLGDVHGIEDAPAVDVLTGGFPCQSYSVAGRRGGLADDRGALWWEFHRLIAGLRPTWVVGENVPGLLSSRGGADFETILGSLTQLGYGVAWAVLDAQYFGVAQRRRRVFIVGHSGGVPRPEVLALGEGVFGHPAPSREKGEGIAPALAARTRSGGGLGTHTELGGGLIAFNWQASGADWMNPNADGTDALHAGQTPAIALQNTSIGRSDNAGPEGKGYLDDGSMYTVDTRDPHAVAFVQNQRGEVRDLDRHGWVATSTGPLATRTGSPRGTETTDSGHVVAFAQNQRGEVRDLDDKAGALAAEPGMKQQTYVAGAQVRRLTPLECERLQGFPDGWTAIPGNSDTQRYRQLGNAVAVPVVEWIMRRIAESG